MKKDSKIFVAGHKGLIDRVISNLLNLSMKIPVKKYLLNKLYAPIIF